MRIVNARLRLDDEGVPRVVKSPAKLYPDLQLLQKPPEILKVMTEVFEIHREAQLIQKVMDAYEEACINDTTPMQNVLSSFVNAKDRLFIKLINEEKNREMLQDIPHRMVQDLAIVYALHLKDALDFSGTVTVTNTLLQMWGIDEETLYTLMSLT